MRISDWSSDVCSSDLLRIDGRNDGGTVFPLAPPDRQGVSDAARKVFWVRRREFGGMDRTNARMLNSLRSPCQGVPVWRKLEATRGGRIEIGRASCRERVCQDV